MKNEKKNKQKNEKYILDKVQPISTVWRAGN